MTVSSQTSTATFVGNGVATAFPLPFRFFDNGDIRAYFIDSVTGAATQMLLGTDYTLIGAGEPEVDGNALSLLTTTVPLASMRGLYVERVMQPVQGTDIVNQGQFFASTHEDVFDRLTMLIQQGFDGIGRALKRPVGKSYFDAEGRLISNVQNPVQPQDAATKGFVQQEIADLLQVGSGSANNSANVLYVPNPSGQIPRTAQDRLRDKYSVRDYIDTQIDGTTSNQVGIEAAVQAANAVGGQLWWPVGTYVSTANIPNLHRVKHTGPGIIKRGANLFSVEPTTQTNTLYLGGAAGSATNDGLSVTEPFNNWQPCFDALANYGPILQGSWVVEAAAGTYTSAAGQQTFRVPSVNRVVFRGPSVGGHPNIPTAIISGTANTGNYVHGLVFHKDTHVQVQDLKFTGFSGDPAGKTRGALLFDEGANGHTKNVHVTGSSWFGVYWSRRSVGRQEGGIIDACRNGVNTDGSKCTVGYNATSIAEGTVVKNCSESGVYWSRGTDGHVDFCKIEDNAIGLFIDSNSRVDSISNNFKRNNIGVRTSSSGMFGNNPSSVSEFNIGTADANTQADVEYKGLSGEPTELAAGTTPVRIASDRTTRTTSGVGSATLTTPYTIPAGRLRGESKSIRVVVHGIYTVTTGSGVVVTFGGMSLTLAVPGAATGVTFKCEVELFDVSGGYRSFGSLGHNLVAARTGMASTGFVNTAASTVTVGSVLTGAGDTISIYRTDVFISG